MLRWTCPAIALHVWTPAVQRRLRAADKQDGGVAPSPRQPTCAAPMLQRIQQRPLSLRQPSKWLYAAPRWGLWITGTRVEGHKGFKGLLRLAWQEAHFRLLPSFCVRMAMDDAWVWLWPVGQGQRAPWRLGKVVRSIVPLPHFRCCDRS